MQNRRVTGKQIANHLSESNAFKFKPPVSKIRVHMNKEIADKTHVRPMEEAPATKKTSALGWFRKIFTEGHLSERIKVSDIFGNKHTGTRLGLALKDGAIWGAGVACIGFGVSLYSSAISSLPLQPPGFYAAEFAIAGAVMALWHLYKNKDNQPLHAP